MNLKIYTYAQCDTCRRAVKWLRSRGLAFEELPIRETPPRRSELQAMLKAQGGEMRALFNTAGRDYRAQKLGEQLPTLEASAAIALLESNGNLVKRPFLIGQGVGLVGFHPERWAERLHLPQ